MKTYKIIIIFTSIILTGCNLDKFDKEKIRYLRKTYPYLLRDDSFIGIIDSTFTTSVPKESLFITLKDGKRFVTAANSYNTNGHGFYYLDDLLKQSDSIEKPKGKDSLYVYKNNRKYTYFIPTKEFSDSVFHRK